MYNVKKAIKAGRVFPDKERDVEVLMIGDGDIFILSQLIGRMAKAGTVKINLGDSDISISIDAYGNDDDTGWGKFMDDLAYFIRKAIPSMSMEYKNFYMPFLKDFEARQQVCYTDTKARNKASA